MPPQIPALAVLQVNDVFPGTVPRIPGPGLALYTDSAGAAAFWDTAASGGLPGQFFIDPTIAQDNAPRFKTIQAALNYASAHLLTSAVIELVSGATYTESLTFPRIGDYEIMCKGTSRSASIVGNISVSTDRARFTNVAITGNISGDSTNHSGSLLFLTNTDVIGTITLTAVDGISFWFLVPSSDCEPFLGSGGSVTGNVSVAGSIFANGYLGFGTLSVASISRIVNCKGWLNVTLTNTSTQPGILTLENCTPLPAGVPSFTRAGSTAFVPLITADDATMARLVSRGATLTNCALQRAELNQRRVLNGNLSTASLSATTAPGGLYSIFATLEMLTPGTGGTLGVNVQYTDLNNNAVTESLLAPGGAAMALAVNAAAATKARGSLLFSHKSGSAIMLNVTGVTTAGALAYSLGGSLRREE